ncbi:MAG: diacylglycerol kinase family lipid kinase, partial [Chloroflexi bacterium]|nr:diacylglycerol kinase family lipid kinase [Chloroflexota bacterium]
NVWARELGLPLDPEPAIARQLATEPRQVDLGRANGRLYLAVASAGLDARIVEIMESDRSPKRLGQLAYPLVALSLAPEVRGVRAVVRFDDQAPLEVNLLLGVISNGRLYGGVFPLLPRAQLDDGLLDVVLFAGGGAVEAMSHAARVLTGLQANGENVIRRTVRRVHIDTLEQSLPVQCDGDPLGSTPLEIEVMPQALRVLGIVG